MKFWGALVKLRSGQVYSCFICPQKFQLLKSYSNHLKLTHKLSGNSPHCCHICGSWLERKQFLYHFRNIFKFHKQLLLETSPIPMLGNMHDYGEVFHHDDNLVREARTESPDLHKILAKLLAGILKSGKMPMSTKDEIFKNFKHFVHTILDLAISISANILQGDEPIEEKIEKLKSIKDLGQVFSRIDSKHKLDKYLIANGFLIPPKEIVLDSDIFFRQVQGVQHPIYQPIKMQYVPISDSIRQLLQKPGFFEILEQNTSYNGEWFSSFRSGKFFRDIKFPKDTIFINIYFDEAEVANPLGSKSGKHKLANFYYTVQDIPQHYNTSTDNIILLCSLKSADLKLSSANAVVGVIVKELIQLWENGIDFEHNGIIRNVKVALSQISGDNLGLHSILGFSEGFCANFPCRRCKMHKKDCQTITTENMSILRNMANYEQDVRISNLALTGINFESVLNKLPYHHVTNMLVFDVMHDLLEGVIPDFLVLFFNYCITSKFFNFDKLNYRLDSFDYGRHFLKSKPSQVKQTVLKGETKSGQNSSQNLCLIITLPLILGDLVPEVDEKWTMMLILREITDILLFPQISKGGLIYLDSLISEFCYKYQVEFSKKLKPKHHHLIHYSKAIEQIGSLKQYWSMTYEARHKFFKTTAHVVCNFKNIPKTLAYRHQLSHCFSLMSKDVFSPSNFVVANYEHIKSCDHFRHDLLQQHFGNSADSFVKTANLVICNNSDYRVGCYVLLDYCRLTSSFGQIVDIILESDDCYF